MDRAQVKRAAEALQRHLEVQAKKAKTSQLFEDAEMLHIQIMLVTVPYKPKTSPFVVPLPHPIHDDDTELCVFTKDPQKEYRELFAEHDIKAKVIGFTKLRDNYKTFEGRRKLCGSYDIFLTDKRVVRMLPALLGKPFFSKKKQPVTIDITNPTKIQAQIDQVLAGTVMFLGYGPCIVRIAKSDMSAEEIADNILAGMEYMVGKFKDGWNSVQSVHLKSQESVALPLYNQLPEAAVAIPEKKAKKAKKAEPEAEAELEAASGKKRKRSASNAADKSSPAKRSKKAKK